MLCRKDVRMRLDASGSAPIFCANDIIILMIHSFNAQVVRLLLLFSWKDVRMRLDASGSAPIFCAIEAIILLILSL